MTAFAWLWLLAASLPGVELTNRDYVIPAGEWRYLEVSASNTPALLNAEFHAREGSPRLTLALLRGDDLDRLREDKPHGVLATAAPGPLGRLEHYLVERGGYAVVLDNRGASEPAAIMLRVRITESVRYSPSVTRLPRDRQLAVILSGFGVFFGIVAWSARKLLSGLRGR